MGADWLKFKVNADVNLTEARQLSAFVSEQYPHGHWRVTPAGFSNDKSIRDQWSTAFDELKNLLLFPQNYHQGYWGCTSLTDPPGGNLEVFFGVEPRKTPDLADIDICRVYVISHNPIFPIEWRDEAYRVILPEELPHYYDKWRTYIEQVRAGLWQHYLHELYLHDSLADGHQYEQVEILVRFANESLTHSKAWCRKEEVGRIRDQILQFAPFESLNRMRNSTAIPCFEESKQTLPVSADERERVRRYWELREMCIQQMREWNRSVPKRWKVQFPATLSLQDFLARAEDSWLKYFFAWCEYLIAEEYGLFLWA